MPASCGISFIDNFTIGPKLLVKIAFAAAPGRAVQGLWQVYW
jgi:hypothetical protein